MNITELYIEGNLVELTDEIPIPLTFTVANIKDPAKRNSSFSKTIRVPGTKVNNNLFGHTYDLQVRSGSGIDGNFGTNFNRKKKADFLLIDGGSNVLSGTAQLQSVVVNDGKITYNVVLYGELSNLINEIGDRELTDLDGSELNHEYTIENVESSWTSIEGYTYPLIDYGIIETRMESVTLNNFRPAVFVKWYWDKIFEEVGFTYEGEFLETTLFNRLIIPFNRESTLQAPLFEEIELQSTDEIGNLANNTILYDVALSDPDNAWDESTQTLTTPISSVYNFSSVLGLVLGGLPDSDEPLDLVENRAFEMTFELLVDSIVEDTFTVSISQGQVYSAELDNNGDPITRPRLSIFPSVFFTRFIEAGKEVQIRFTDTRPAEPYINVNTDTNLGGNLNILLREEQTMDITPGSAEGIELSFSEFVPTSFKQRDFILGILKLFNLYIEPDKNRPKHLIVRQREQYYGQEFEVKDWTNKLALDRDTKNELVNESLIKTLQYKFKHDEDDYFLNLYKERWGREYGERRIDTGYEFSKELKDVLNLPFGTVVPIQYPKGALAGDTRIEVPENNPRRVRVIGFTQLQAEDPTESDPDLPEFERVFIGRKIQIATQEDPYTVTALISPWEFEVERDIDATNSQVIDSINYRVWNRTYQYVGTPDKVVPAIFKSDDRAITVNPFDSEVRICVFNGFVPSVEWTIQQTPIKPQNGILYSYPTDGSISQSFLFYPFTSHISGDTPTTGEFDLLFEQPRQIFWNI